MIAVPVIGKLGWMALFRKPDMGPIGAERLL